MNPAMINLYLSNRWILKYSLLFLACLALFGLAGVLLALFLSGFAYSSWYRFWLVKQPGYKYYLSRLPGLNTIDPPVKLSFMTLLYLFPSSLLCTWLLLNVFSLTSGNNLFFFTIFCIFSLVLVFTWFKGKWGFRDRSFTIETSGVVKTSRWRKFLAGMELDVSSHVSRELRLRGSSLLGFYNIPARKRALELLSRGLHSIQLVKIIVYIMAVPIALLLYGIILFPLGLCLVCLTDYRRWLMLQPGYTHRLSKLPGLRSRSRLQELSFIRLALVTAVYLVQNQATFLGMTR